MTGVIWAQTKGIPNMADLVERLGKAACNPKLPIGEAWNLLDEASAEIERLRAALDNATVILETLAQSRAALAKASPKRDGADK
jgi:hypothetical protein